MSSALNNVEIVDVEDTEALAVFDRVCGRHLGMSREEFIEKYRRGDFDGVDPDSMPGLSKVLSILPFAGI